MDRLARWSRTMVIDEGRTRRDQHGEYQERRNVAFDRQARLPMLPVP